VDRDGQFAQINSTCKEFEQKGAPIISVDCKKKELLGNFKNTGREWQAKGEETSVNVYDFLSLADGKAVPYGGLCCKNSEGTGETWSLFRLCLGDQSKQAGDKRDLSSDVPFFHPVHLPFAKHIHTLVSL
jgi:Rhodopirellula transposase DDE domain